MQDDLIASVDLLMWQELYAETDIDGSHEDRVLMMLAAYRQQAEDAMRERCADMLRKAIEDGYPTPADRTAQCEHGQYGWEDCIACYDEQLLNVETAIRATPPKPDRLNGEGDA